MGTLEGRAGSCDWFSLVRLHVAYIVCSYLAAQAGNVNIGPILQSELNVRWFKAIGHFR